MAKVNEGMSGERRCESCSKTFRPKEHRHRTCRECFQKGRAGGVPGSAGESGGSATGLPVDYLKKGYFDGDGNIFPELVTGAGEEVARRLGVGGVTSTQLRRFYSKAKTAEQRLDAGEPFASVVASILELKQHAANAVGKAQGRDEEAGLRLFKDVIDRNVDQAVRSEKAFRKGFLIHFQGVVAYFKFHNPKK
jgi:CRISPR type III-A-associated protein Csm2